MLPSRDRLLLVGILVLKQSDLVLVLRQRVLSFREIEAVLCLIHKGGGRLFENYFIDPHCRSHWLKRRLDWASLSAMCALKVAEGMKLIRLI